MNKNTLDPVLSDNYTADQYADYLDAAFADPAKHEESMKTAPRTTKAKRDDDD